MRRATTDAVKQYVSAFVLRDDIGPFVPATETSRLMSGLMREYSGIYCGTMPDKAWGTLFIVHSASTSKVFCKIRVK